MSSCRPGWLRQICTIYNRGSGVRTRSSPIGSAQVIVHRGFGRKMGFQVLLIFIFLFKIIISYKQCIEHNIKFTTNVCNYIRLFCDIIYT